jgi:prepilin-type N-terminal cleavage/methylation domain
MRKDKKGFTLVEIIVVLVILAILAAFMIPSMLGFVADAKKKAAVAEQREIYVAAQAIATEYFAKDATTAASKLGITTTNAAGADAANLGSTEVAKYGKANKMSDGTAKTTALAAINDATKAMGNYLGTDITANGTNSDSETANSTWTVSVDTNGQVREVTYTKNGVTLDPLKPSSAVK